MMVPRVFGLGDAYYLQGIVFHVSDSYNFQLSMWLKRTDTCISLWPQRVRIHMQNTRPIGDYDLSKYEPKTVPCTLCRLNDVRPYA